MFLKDPAARLDYGIDWSEQLPTGVAIVASSWVVDPDEPGGVRVVAHRREGATCVAWLEGGTAGRAYRVVNRVELSDGAVDERSLVVRVEQR